MTARIGLATGYDPVLSVSEFAEAVREVDRRGWEIAFFSETIGLMRDSVTALAAFAACTTRVTLGCTQVVRLRSPVLMAQTLASLDELSGGRIVLCPGACTRVHAEKHGLEPTRRRPGRFGIRWHGRSKRRSRRDGSGSAPGCRRSAGSRLT